MREEGLRVQDCASGVWAHWALQKSKYIILQTAALSLYMTRVLNVVRSDGVWYVVRSDGTLRMLVLQSSSVK